MGLPCICRCMVLKVVSGYGHFTKLSLLLVLSGIPHTICEIETAIACKMQ